MGISTFSQLRTSMMNDFNRFGELEHIANALQEICDFNEISELARIQQESASQVREIMQSMMSNANDTLNALIPDANRNVEEAFRTLSDQIADAIAGICNLGGISELDKIQQESAGHLAEMIQSMMSNNGIVDLLADANRLSEAAICNFRDELTLLSETSNFFNRELLNEFGRHESLVEVVCNGGAISDQRLSDWLTQTINKDYKEESNAVDDGIKNIGELTPESEIFLVRLICAYLIFLIIAISLHNRGETLDATELAKLALNILPIIYPLLRFKQH